MVFQFTTFNITGLGKLAMTDIIALIGRQLEALGHEVFWSDDGFAIDPNVYVCVFESFFAIHLEVLRAAAADGAKIIIIATEAPSARGFNEGLTQELIIRQGMFTEATKYAKAIWVTILNAVPWYSQWKVPTANLELGYAPGSVREIENVLDHDYGFFGSLTERRLKILHKFARSRVDGHRALVRYTQFESCEQRDEQMVRARVILQIRGHDRMAMLSTSRCCTALHLGRPVIAEHHLEPGVWADIIEFAHPDVLIIKAARMHKRWREAYAEQFERFKSLLTPEACVGRTLKETLVEFQH